jgi:hypothetical protein
MGLIMGYLFFGKEKIKNPIEEKSKITAEEKEEAEA